MTKLFPTLMVVISLISTFSFGASQVELRETSFECKKQLCKLKVQFNSDTNLPSYFWEKQGDQVSVYFAQLKSSMKQGTYKLNAKQEIQIQATQLEGQDVLKLTVSPVKAKDSNFSELLKKSIYELNWKSVQSSKKVWVSKLKPMANQETESKEVSKSKGPSKPIEASKAKKSPEVEVKEQATVSKTVQPNNNKAPEQQAQEPKKTPKNNSADDDLEDFVKRQKEIKLNPNKLFGFKSLKQEYIVTKQSILYQSKNLKKKVQDLMPGDIVIGTKLNSSIVQVKSQGLEGFVKLKYLKNSASLTPSENEALKKLALEIIEKKKSSKKPVVNVDETKSVQGVPEVKQNKDTKFYSYSSFGRKDPFIPFEDEIEEGMNIDAVQIVGIIWEETAPIVIMEEVNGSGATYTLKENDPIQNGKVYKITPNEVVFELTEFGITRRFAMQLPNLQEEGSK